MEVYVPAEDGRWVNESYARLAEIVKDYDATLELRWIPPDRRTREDKKPYVIIDTRINEPVLYASELDTPEEILARLFDADNKYGNVLTRLENRNKAVEIFDAKKQMEKMEEATDYAEFLFKSPLNTVKANGKKYDDQRRIVGTAEGRKIL
jgi:hypothetical protein